MRSRFLAPIITISIVVIITLGFLIYALINLPNPIKFGYKYEELDEKQIYFGFIIQDDYYSNSYKEIPIGICLGHDFFLENREHNKFYDTNYEYVIIDFIYDGNFIGSEKITHFVSENYEATIKGKNISYPTVEEYMLNIEPLYEYDSGNITVSFSLYTFTDTLVTTKTYDFQFFNNEKGIIFKK